MRTLIKSLSLPLLLMVAAPAFAHPGHELHAAGFVEGLLHPLLGLDHLQAMLIVGVWAAQLGGAARVWVPASFLLLMAAGAALSISGFVLPQIEAGIAASLLVLGMAATLVLRVPLLPAMLLVGVFAVFHGAAHGLELPTLAQPVSFACGFLMVTAGLHAVGMMLPKLPLIARTSGALTIAAGFAYAIA
jgi:urease accessory protein